MATALDTIGNLTGAGITEAQEKTWFTAMRAAMAEMGDPLGKFGVLQNLSLVASVGSNALTIALKDRAGNDPSAASPCSIPFRNVTITTGDFSVINVTAATSVVVSSGSTLGTRSGIASRVWVVGFNDAGTFRLGVINCVTSVAGAGAGSDVTAIYPLNAWGIASSTAEGGAGAADSAQTFYTGTAVASKAYVVLGYVTFEGGQATAGTWATSPSRVQLFGAGVPLPGRVIQMQRNETGAVATGTTTVPIDDTIPQNTEGDQYLSQAITPSSAANVLAIAADAHASNNNGNLILQSLYQDATANALKTSGVHAPAGGNIVRGKVDALILAGLSTSTTFKLRIGGVAGTITVNGSAGSRYMGGAFNSFIQAQEIMG